MKVQIDTVNKVIKVEASVNLSEFFEFLNVSFPKDAWKEYSLETVTVITNWTTPIVIDRPVYIPQPSPAPFQPWSPNLPWITCGSGNTSNIPVNVTGVYNVEVQ